MFVLGGLKDTSEFSNWGCFEAEMISEASQFHVCDSLDRVFREKLFVSACKELTL